MTDTEKRKLNKKVIEDYLFGTLKEGIDSSDYFAEDGVQIVPFNPTGKPVEIKGRTAIKKVYDENALLFQNWRYTKAEFYPTVNPDIFWLEAQGEGEALFSGRPEPYKNNYFFYFELKDGKIVVFKEIMDSIKLVKEMGIDLPEFPSPHDEQFMKQVEEKNR